MAQELVNSGSERVISGLKPLMLLVGVAAAIAAGVGVMLWSVGPTYSLLYANLAAEDAAQITQALDSARIPYKLEDGVGVDQRAGRAARRRAAQARRAGPARKRRRRERHDQGSGLRRQRVHGERALPACARNRARAHHRRPAERAGRARAPGHGAAVRVRQRSPAGFRVGIPADQGRPPSRRRAGAGHRESRGFQHSGDLGLAGHGGRPGRPAAVLAEDRQRSRRCATRCSSSRIASKKPMRNASRRC